jgi:hypothetical protein
VGFVEACDERAGEVRAFRDGEGKSFFQKFGGFLGQTLIIMRNIHSRVKARPPAYQGTTLAEFAKHFDTAKGNVITKSFVVAIGAALSLAGCQDTRVTNLEKRVGHLEQTLHQLEADKTKTAADDSARRTKLESCLADANAAFQADIVNNGTKQRNGSYNVPVPVQEQMERRKQGKVEECRLLYSK